MKYVVCSLLLFFSILGFAGPQQPPAPIDGVNVELNFFWSHRCPHCLEARPFVNELARKYAWLKINDYDLIDHPANARRYVAMAKGLNMTANSVPAFIFCKQMLVGFDKTGAMKRRLEEALVSCHNSKQMESAETDVEIPILGKIRFQDYSLPVLTLFIAALDAFNPCAFFVLFFLLSLMAHTRSRVRVSVVGATYVFISGLMYFLFMAAWLNLFLLTRELAIITVIAGMTAVLIGAINIKDYFFFQQGFSLSIPETAKPGLFQRMRNLVQAGKWPAMITASVVLAIAANSYELLCTAGLPMVYTRILTLHPLSEERYYLYLAFYNLIYIIPLFLIVLVYTWTLGSKKLSEQQGRLLKLLSGLMMLSLGGMLLIMPELLNNMLASAAILALAVAITLIFYILGRVRSNAEFK